MSVWPWVTLASGALVAALAAAADGALLSERGAAPFAADRDLDLAAERLHDRAAERSAERASEKAAPSPLMRAIPAKERTHRALAFARLLGHGTAGGSLALALGLDGRITWPELTVLLAVGLVVVVLAESVARAVGELLGERVSSSLGTFSLVTERVLSPIVRLGEMLDGAFAEVVPDIMASVERREEAAAQFREVITSEADVSRDERELLLGVFSFGETTAEEVMVPRVDIVGIDQDAPWSEVIDRVRSSQHSRLPVYEETLDEIVGILYAKDLLAHVIDDAEPADGWRALARPPAFIPPSKRIADLLREFKINRRHIVIVADEYGGTAGLVTIEDVLEELVGEIRDEFDDEERIIDVEDDTRFWVSGRLTLDDLSDALGYDFRRDDVTTVGGLVLELLGRVPRAGEAFAIGPFRVITERVIRRKIERVYFERSEPVVDAPRA